MIPNLLPPEYGNLFLLFFFAYVRVAALIFSMPVFGNQTVIRPVRNALAFWIAIVIMAPSLGLYQGEHAQPLPPVTVEYHGFIQLIVAVIAEMMIGFTLGFIGQVLINAISLSGEIIGQQAGFSAASVLDPITGQDIFLMATIKIWFATIIFIIIGGPQTVLQVMTESFRFIAPGVGYSLAEFGKIGYEIFNFSEGRRDALASIVYKLGVQIAMPMIAAMILISIAEAFIARTAPQLNILVVGFAIRIAIGLYLLAYMMEFTFKKFESHLYQYTKYAGAVLERLGTA